MLFLEKNAQNRPAMGVVVSGRLCIDRLFQLWLDCRIVVRSIDSRFRSSHFSRRQCHGCADSAHHHQTTAASFQIQVQSIARLAQNQSPLPETVSIAFVTPSPTRGLRFLPVSVLCARSCVPVDCSVVGTARVWPHWWCADCGSCPAGQS